MSASTQDARPGVQQRPPNVRSGDVRAVKQAGPKKVAGYAVLILFSVFSLYPFVIQIATSFKSDAQASAAPLGLIPNPFDFGAWKRIFGLSEDTSVPIMTWLGNSVLVTVFVTAGRVFFDSLAGYALSRLSFRGTRSSSLPCLRS